MQNKMKEGYGMKMMVEVFTAEEARKKMINARSKGKKLALEYAMQNIQFAAGSDYCMVKVDLSIPLLVECIRPSDEIVNYVKEELQKLKYDVFSGKRKTELEIWWTKG